MTVQDVMIKIEHLDQIARNLEDGKQVDKIVLANIIDDYISLLQSQHVTTIIK